MRFRILLCFLSLIALPSLAQEEVQLIGKLTTASSRQRILAMSIYYEENAHSRKGRTPQKLDSLLTAAYRIAENSHDSEFIQYLNFFSRLKPVMFVPDGDLIKSEQKMLKIWTQNMAYYHKNGDQRFAALCQANIGLVQFNLKQYAQSVENLLLADTQFKQIGYQRFPAMGSYLHNMALVFYFFGDYAKVVELMETAIKLPPHDQNRDIQRYNTLGAAYVQLKQYKKAEVAFKQTIERASAYHDTIWIAISSRSLAALYLNQGKYLQALQLYQSTLGYTKTANNINNREYADHLLGIAKTYILMDSLSNAHRYLQKIHYRSVSDTKQHHNFGKDYQDMSYWQAYYEVQRQYQLATHSYRLASLYADSLYHSKYLSDSTFNKLRIQSALFHLQAQHKQFENDNKEEVIRHKNQLLVFILGLLAVIIAAIIMVVWKNKKISAQNKIINGQVAELTKTMEQKQVLLNELQHRVKNNLQHVISILEMQKESVDFNNIDELIRENQNRIHSMALLHKKLNILANVNEVDLNTYIQELAKLVLDSYHGEQKKISLAVDCQLGEMAMDRALCIGLIAVELVSNSMKHAFEEYGTGSIQISILKGSNGKPNSFVYHDNGKGFNFNHTSKKGLGLEIIKGLIDQLDATIQTPTGNGFDLIIHF